MTKISNLPPSNKVPSEQKAVPSTVLYTKDKDNKKPQQPPSSPLALPPSLRDMARRSLNARHIPEGLLSRLPGSK